jgi:hypothetical protein
MTALRSAQPRSLLRYSPSLLAFIIVVADAGRWADPDLWGHLVFGRLILTHGHLPPRDIYSYRRIRPAVARSRMALRSRARALQLFDFVALSALLFMLARESYRRAGRLWLAIPIFAL